MSAPSILLIAPFDDAEHAHSTQRARALERLGCDVTTFDLRKRMGLLGRLAGSDIRSRLIKSVEAAEANLVLVIGGYDLDEALIEAVRSATGARMVNWFPDDVGSIDEAFRVARGYDQIFVAGSDVAAAFERSTGSAPEVLPHAADPSVYRPLRTKDQYRANVVFAGGATPTREKYLSELVEFGLALWGPGWRKSTLRDYCRGELRSTAEYVRAYGGASVAVNLHHGLGSNGLSYAFCNQRVFELATMGVPQVVDQRADLPKLFDTTTEIITFTTPRELKSRVQELLQTPAHTEEIGGAARRRALHEHTYMHRMRRLLAAAGVKIDEADPIADAAVE
ncbi:MAG: glycosyltransferase [Gemmatimonadetes bacterium]|uniref:Glycosyltransferase n=1 Tax=Candidatus Tanganyikabacteria bacterium TaxID=2961651 RepID=A0A938BP87_9BACT|nr:glycosyltransferase [Candidatus Tanganyikabacteria bacterium]MBM4186964.1 glycosyltransferase [Gemmatimonadota bacterium]